MVDPASLSSADPAQPAVRVRLFAALREAAGWSERLIAWPCTTDPGPCTPLRLWQGLAIPSPWSTPVRSVASDPGPPQLASSWPVGLRVAINQRFAPPDTPLHPGDELAFLPPITGG
jgi:molybdopterin synthase sulfur carrier subunit